jgi:hypothetical protein
MYTKFLNFLQFFPSPPKHPIDAVKIARPAALHLRTARHRGPFFDYLVS